MRDLPPSRLTRPQVAPELPKRPGKERPDEVGLQFPRFCLLHIGLDRKQPPLIYHRLTEGILPHEIPQAFGIEGPLDPLHESRPHLWVVAVADRLDQQVPQTPFVKDLSEDVKDPAAKGLSLRLQLLEQPLVNIALPCLGRHQIPEAADLRLPDTVDPAEPLLQPVRVPRQVVVHHQVSVLQVYALPGCVGGDEDPHRRIAPEHLLLLPPLLP